MSASPVFGVAPCTGCKHPTRSCKMRKEDWPGTRVRHGQGLCGTCAGRLRRTGNVLPSADAKELQHRNNVSGLEAYMADRRRRGVPAEGIRFEYQLEDAA